MHRRIVDDAPTYAAAAIASAQFGGHQLAASSGLLAVLLAVMSLAETPLSQLEEAARYPAEDLNMPVGSLPAHQGGNTPVAHISTASPAGHRQPAIHLASLCRHRIGMAQRVADEHEGG